MFSKVFCHISSAVGAQKCHYDSENVFFFFFKYFVFVLHLFVMHSLPFRGLECFFSSVLKVCMSWHVSQKPFAARTVD